MTYRYKMLTSDKKFKSDKIEYPLFRKIDLKKSYPANI